MDKFYKELSQIDGFNDFLLKRLEMIRKAISEAVATRDFYAACELNGRINELDDLAKKVNESLQIEDAKS